MNKDMSVKVRNKESNRQSTDSKDLSVADFIVAKNERLVSAVYMITSLLPDNEPIKWEIRKQALCLLSEVPVALIPMRQKSLNLDEMSYADMEKISVLINEMLSLINVALAGGTVSQMNLTILKQEYESLREVIENNFSRHNFKNYLLSGREDNLTPLKMSAELPVRKNIESDNFSYKNNQKDNSNNVSNTQVDQVSNETQNKSSVKEENGEINKKTDKPHGNGVSAQEVKNKRQQRIIDFLKDKDWTSIKDISNEISECSSKTVQRDLVDLVDSGQIIKTGERRWSRYKIA